MNRVDKLISFDMKIKGRTILDIIESYITRPNHANDSISSVCIRFLIAARIMHNLNHIKSVRIRSNHVTRGLRVSREQLFLRLLLTTCRASEYTLDLEGCLGTLRQS
jgi:hypothetical protein